MPRRTRCKVRFSRWCGFSNFAWSVTSRSQTLDPGRGLNRPFPMEWKTFYVLLGAPSNFAVSLAPLLASLICDARESKLGLCFDNFDRSICWPPVRERGGPIVGSRMDGWMDGESNDWTVKVWFKNNCNLGIADWIIVMGLEESEG